MATMDEAMGWLNNGLAIVILFAIGFATWKVVKWVGDNVVIPVRDALVGHLATVDATLKGVGESMVFINQSLKDVHARLDKYDRTNERLETLEANSRRDG